LGQGSDSGMWTGRFAVLAAFVAFATCAYGGAALFVEEPYGSFGAVNPTGHAAVYLSHVCAETPVKLRLCEAGESGVVISRYHRVGGYDWIAIPLIPYLYAVDRVDEIPASVDPNSVAELRDNYRRAHLASIVPTALSASDIQDSRIPDGNWIQLVGSSYDRTIYSFEIETTETQDARLIADLNARANNPHFNLLFHNCADFARAVLNFYYPGSVHRGILNDVGIMTPKQAARTLAKYSRRHQDLQFTSLQIPQIPGLAKSTHIRGVFESFVKSKKYVLPVAALHPFVIGGLGVFYIAQAIFEDPVPPMVSVPALPPAEIAFLLQAGRSLQP
jgi:hypothetical protein